MDNDDDEEAETDNIVNQVLDEIGINLNSELVDAPQGMAAAAATATKAEPKEPVAEIDSADQDLQDRLANLRKQP